MNILKLEKLNSIAWDKLTPLFEKIKVNLGQIKGTKGCPNGNSQQDSSHKHKKCGLEACSTHRKTRL